MTNYKEIPIYTGVLGGMAFVFYLLRMANTQMIIALVVMSTFGALVSIGLQFLLKRAYMNEEEKSSILQNMNISVLPFTLFFVLIIASITIFKVDLTFQQIVWGLFFSFLSSLIMLFIKLIANKEKQISVIKASTTFAILTIIALSIPSTLHWYIWNSSPCANGQCKIENHEGH